MSEEEERPLTIKERMALLQQENKKATAVVTSEAPTDLPSAGSVSVRNMIKSSQNPEGTSFKQIIPAKSPEFYSNFKKPAPESTLSQSMGAFSSSKTISGKTPNIAKSETDLGTPASPKSWAKKSGSTGGLPNSPGKKNPSSPSVGSIPNPKTNSTEIKATVETDKSPSALKKEGVKSPVLARLQEKDKNSSGLDNGSGKKNLSVTLPKASPERSSNPAVPPPPPPTPYVSPKPTIESNIDILGEASRVAILDKTAESGKKIEGNSTIAKNGSTIDKKDSSTTEKMESSIESSNGKIEVGMTLAQRRSLLTANTEEEAPKKGTVGKLKMAGVPIIPMGPMGGNPYAAIKARKEAEKAESESIVKEDTAVASGEMSHTSLDRPTQKQKKRPSNTKNVFLTPLSVPTSLESEEPEEVELK